MKRSIGRSPKRPSGDRFFNRLLADHEPALGVRQPWVCSIARLVFSGHRCTQIMRCIKELDGIRIEGVNLKNLRYADDTAASTDCRQ